MYGFKLKKNKNKYRGKFVENFSTYYKRYWLGLFYICCAKTPLY